MPAKLSRPTNDARQALSEAADRVSVLAEARDRSRREQATLEAALKQVCTALNSQAEPRSIRVSLEFAAVPNAMNDDEITCIALCVNELATNAIKHAYTNGRPGIVSISVEPAGSTGLRISVTDDGEPLRLPVKGKSSGMGLGLVTGLLRAIGLRLRLPAEGSKRFEIVPDQASAPSSASATAASLS